MEMPTSPTTAMAEMMSPNGWLCIEEENVSLMICYRGKLTEQNLQVISRFFFIDELRNTAPYEIFHIAICRSGY